MTPRRLRELERHLVQIQESQGHLDNHLINPRRQLLAGDGGVNLRENPLVPERSPVVVEMTLEMTVAAMTAMDLKGPQETLEEDPEGIQVAQVDQMVRSLTAEAVEIPAVVAVVVAEEAHLLHLLLT